jgi:hypothetical protein
MARKKLNLHRSSLEDHAVQKKELVPPFLRMGTPTEQIFWTRDLLPHFLWIDSLVSMFGRAAAVQVFREFLSAADQFNSDDKEILDGTIGAFELIPNGRRATFLADLKVEIEYAVTRPFGSILSLYPACPMYWMIKVESLDRNASIADARSAVNRLSPGKDEHCGFCRTLPIARLFAHKKLFISSDMKELADALDSYPNGDRYHVEAFARSVHNSLMLHREEKTIWQSWSKTFWQANRELVPCRYET